MDFFKNEHLDGLTVSSAFAKALMDVIEMHEMCFYILGSDNDIIDVCARDRHSISILNKILMSCYCRCHHSTECSWGI